MRQSRGIGVVLAGGVAMVGAASSVTVTLALPLVPLIDAVTWKVPRLFSGAVYRPVEVMVPPLACVDQLNGGGLLMTLPNWSRAVALNCLVRPCLTDVLEGETVMLVTVAETVTFSVALVVISPSEIATWSV